MKRRITEENEHEQPAGTSSEPETTAQGVEARKRKRIKNFTDLDESVSLKPGTLSEDDVVLIAHELGPSWKVFGRVLKVPDSVINKIDVDKPDVAEKCYCKCNRVVCIVIMG
ncbi:uncharacterized protein LOC122953265 isoform X2 [Acropora millepora]|uniref:uncharacterized protein LOC122953265 isoform X2 n=1 Tax=Acropora millepora TaxID=45264 RepID=UPI001CF5628F|nr:uncharacterized protein LOC122953265 isoform X2 [Acropora millepora]